MTQSMPIIPFVRPTEAQLPTSYRGRSISQGPLWNRITCMSTDHHLLAVGGKIFSILSHNGRHQISPASSAGCVYHWKKEQHLSTLNHGDEEITHVVVEGSRFFSSTKEGIFRMWNWENASCLLSIPIDHESHIGIQGSFVCIASTQENKPVSLRQIQDNTLIQRNYPPTTPYQKWCITCLKVISQQVILYGIQEKFPLHPEASNSFFITEEEGTVSIEEESSECDEAHQQHSEGEVEYSSDEDPLLYGYDPYYADALCVHHLTDLNQTFFLQGHNATILCIDFDAASTLIASGSADGTARIWNWEERTLALTLRHPYLGEQVTHIAFQNHLLIMSGPKNQGSQNFCEIWNVHGDFLVSIASETTRLPVAISDGVIFYIALTKQYGAFHEYSIQLMVIEEEWKAPSSARTRPMEGQKRPPTLTHPVRTFLI